MSDGVEVKSFDLAYLLTLFELRQGAGNADIDIRHVGFQLRGPGIAFRLQRAEVDTLRGMPSFARDFAQERRRLAVDDRLHVVERLVGRTRRGHAARI